MATDYAALAKQFGGTATSAPPPVDFAELAKQFGGTAAPAAKPKAQAAPPAYKNKTELLDDFINLAEEGVPLEKLRAQAQAANISWDEITQHGQARQSPMFQTGAMAPISPEQQRTPSGAMKEVTPTATQELMNVGRRGVAQLERERVARKFQTGQIDAAEAAERLRLSQRKMEAARPSGSVQEGIERLNELNEAGDTAGVAKALISPSNWKALAALVAESAIPSLANIPEIAVAGIAGGPLGAAAASGATSFASEYANALGEVLQKEGVSLSDPYEVTKALEDPKIIDAARERGLKRGIPVAAFDALTAGFGGRFLRTYNRALQAAGTQATKKGLAGAAAKEAGVQIGGGMAGEAAAQAITKEYKPLDILVEGIAELPGGVAEVATNVGRAPAQAAITPDLTAKEILDASAELKRREAEELERQEKPKARGEPTVSATTAPTEKVEPSIKKEGEDEVASPKVLAAEDRKEMIEARAEQLVKLSGFTKSRALDVATREVDDGIIQKAADIAQGPVTSRTDEIAQDLMIGGMPPDQAFAVARRRADEEAQAEGEPSVTGPVIPAVGKSFEISGRPEPTLAPAGVEGAEPSGMVSTEESVAGPVRREEAKPTPLTEEERDTAFEAKKAKAQQIARTNASTAFDQLGEYGGDLDTALDSYRTNMADTLVEEGFKESDDWDALLNAADRAFDAEVNKQKGTPSATTPTEAKQAKEEGAAAPPEGTKVAESATEEFVGPPLITRLPSSEEVRKKTGRGRKKLAPEVAEKKAEEKNKAQAEKARADRALKKAQGDLTLSQAEVDDAELVKALGSKGESEESIRDQQGKLRENAIKQLLRLEANPNLRGTAVGKRVKEAIKNLGLAPQAIEFFRRKIKEEDANRAAVAKKEVLPSQTETTVGPPEDKLSKAQNASQAVSLIAKIGDAFESALAMRLRPFLNGVKFVVIEVGDALPPVLEKNIDSWNRARGIYVPENRTIYVRGKSFGKDQGINNTTILHEALHAATSTKIALGSAASLGGRKDSKLQTLVRDLRDLGIQSGQFYEYLKNKGDLPVEVSRVVEATANENGGYDIFDDPNEFLAYGMSDADFQAFLSALPPKKTQTGFSSFVRILLRSFGLGESKYNALAELIDITDKLLSAQKTPGMRIAEQGLKAFEQRKYKSEPEPVEKKSLKRLVREQRKAEEIVARSRSGTELMEGTKLTQLARNPLAVREYLDEVWDNMSGAAKTAFVRMPTLQFLAEWSKDEVPRIKEINDLVGQMFGTSQQFMRGAVDLINEVKRGYKQDKTLRVKLENLIYDTTLAEYDPSNPKLPSRNPNFDKNFLALGPTGQKLYVRIRNYYESVINLYNNLLDKQIQNLQGVSQETKTNLMAMIRQTFEVENRIRPFFPLVRPDGNFYLRINEGLYADQPEFYIFKTRGARNNAAKKLAEELNPGNPDALNVELDSSNFKLGNNIRDLRLDSLDAAPLLQAVFKAIDEGDFNPVASGMNEVDQRAEATAAREALKDSIYQLYLTTMPEQSFRRQFIHRKGRIGFSVDLTQNIASVAAKQAVQLARLEFSPQLRNAVSAAKDSIAEREELSPFVDEAERRVNAALAGNRGGFLDAVSGVANRLSYIYYMTGISSALIQPFSLLISGVPVLGANHGSMTKAAKELGKMLTFINQYGIVRENPDGTTSYVPPSIANAKGLTPLQKRAVAEMVERGVEQSTYSSLVYGYKSVTTDDFDSIPGKGKRLANVLIAGLLHNIERLTREAVYLASFNLGIGRGLDYEDAVRQAVSDTNEALGNYDIANRPTWMQQGLGKVLFQFKMYPLQMTLLLGTNLMRMIPFMNKEGKAVAIKKFFGVMGMSALVAGVPGMAMFSSIVGLLGWLWSKMSDDDDWPDELREMDLETWLRTVQIPEALGGMSIGSVPVSDVIDRGIFNAMTGWDIASRTQLNDMWGRDSKETKTARDSAIAFMVENMGPTASLGLSMADAYQAYTEGDYQKMWERMSPAAIRNWVMANKMMNEGIKTSAGADLVTKDNVKTGELIGRVLGFNPDINAITQVNNFKLNGVEQKILNKRNLILTRLNVQFKKESEAGDAMFDKIIEDEVSKFNRKYPSYAIDADTIVDSLSSKAERRASAVAGVAITEKSAPLVGTAADKLAERLEKRAEEMAAKRKIDVEVSGVGKNR